jgi:hypothetical protein
MRTHWASSQAGPWLVWHSKDDPEFLLEQIGAVEGIVDLMMVVRRLPSAVTDGTEHPGL